MAIENVSGVSSYANLGTGMPASPAPPPGAEIATGTESRPPSEVEVEQRAASAEGSIDSRRGNNVDMYA